MESPNNNIESCKNKYLNFKKYMIIEIRLKDAYFLVLK